MEIINTRHFFLLNIKARGIKMLEIKENQAMKL